MEGMVEDFRRGDCAQFLGQGVGQDGLEEQEGASSVPAVATLVGFTPPSPTFKIPVFGK